MTRTKTLKDRLVGLALVLAAAFVLGLMASFAHPLGEIGVAVGTIAFIALLFSAARVTNKPLEESARYGHCPDCGGELDQFELEYFNETEVGCPSCGWSPA